MQHTFHHYVRKNVYFTHDTLSFGLVLPDDERRTACLNKLICALLIYRERAHTHAQAHAHANAHTHARARARAHTRTQTPHARAHTHTQLRQTRV